MYANTQVLITDESLERCGQAGVVHSAAPTVTGEGAKKRSTVYVKMDLDGEIVEFELEPKPQLRALV
jgi:hypothetical protein